MATETGRLRCLPVEIRDTDTGDLVGLDVQVIHQGTRKPTADRVPLSTRNLLRSIDDDSAALVANRLVAEGAVTMLGRSRRDWAGRSDGFVAICLEGRFIADESFLPTIKSATRRAGLEANQLLLSVEAQHGFETLWPAIQRLKSHGVRVAVEGFRLGALATELVRRFPFDVLRVDIGALLGDLEDDPAGELKSIVQMAANMRCQVLAEQVVTPEHLQAVTEAGCDQIVGPVTSSGKQ